MDIKDIIKIAVVGPESTGKSSMANFLAKELNTFCVPEYARYYCKNLNNTYTLQDELNMFYGQLALEDTLTSSINKNIIICDTTILTVKIWSDYLFKQTPENVTTEIISRQYDYYLLLDIDLPWENDPLRDFPNEREYFLEQWKLELNNIKANYSMISGLGEQRFKNGLQHCKDFIKNHY